MTTFPSQFRPLPLASVVASRPAGVAIDRLLPRVRPRRGTRIGRRERAAQALVGGAQLLLVCGYAFLIALVWSAVLGPAP